MKRGKMINPLLFIINDLQFDEKLLFTKIKYLYKIDVIYHPVLIKNLNKCVSVIILCRLDIKTRDIKMATLEQKRNSAKFKRNNFQRKFLLPCWI